MNDVEEVKSRLDIVEVISGYVELKKAGKDWRGLSPFRQERTPSFFVSPDKQIWHDFGSSEGGDVISFVMRMEGLSFPEALEMLAARAGVKLTRKRGPGGQTKTRLLQLMELAVKYYHYQLSQSPEALQYLRDKRGVNTEAIKAFSLGFAPDAWTNLLDYAKHQGFTFDEMVAVGLATKRATSKSGGFDSFRGRIMFPIFDAQGRPIGFSGRLLDDSVKAAKYINTPETPLYHKSRAIFGLAQAKEAIRQTERVVLVEGNLDVVSLWQHGQRNVVAASGTALTAEQLKLLGRLAPVIQLCFDQDSAGVKATLRAIALAQELEVKLEVIHLEGVKDPDELLQKSPGSWEKALASAQYAPDYLVKYAEETFRPSDAPGKKAYTKFLLPMISQMRDRIEQEHYLNLVAHRVGVQSEMLRASLARPNKHAEGLNTNAEQSRKEDPKKVLTRQHQFEEFVLEMSLAFPETQPSLSDLNLADVTEENRPLFAYLQANPKSSLKQIIKALPNLADHGKILALRGDHAYSVMTEHERGLEAFTQVHNLQKHIANQKKRQLARDIAALEAAGDMGAAAQKLQAYQRLADAAKDL